MISPSDWTMNRSTPCVDGWCGPMLRSISSSISLVKTTSLIYIPSGLCGSFADLEELEGVRAGRGDAVVLVFLAVVLAKRVALPVVGQKQAPKVGVTFEEHAEKVVALAL